MTGTDFAYSVARIRAIEAKMPGRAGLDRLMETHSEEDACRILREWGFGDSEGSGEKCGYEELLSYAYTKNISLLMEISPEKCIFTPFLTRNDFHNLKVMLKAEFTSLPYDDLLLRPGNVEPDDISHAILERKPEKLPADMAAALSEILEMRAVSYKPREVDIIADRYCYKLMKRLAAEINVQFISELVDIMADVTNIKTFFRVRKLRLGYDFLSSVLVEAGKLGFDFFKEHYSDSPDIVFSKLDNSGYARLVPDELPASGEITASINILSDNMLIEYLKKAKMIALGPEPLVAHYFAREFEMMNIRIILTGRLNALPVDAIKERLRNTYE